AGDAMTGTVLVADRCGDRVLRFDPVAGQLDDTTPVLTLTAPTAVAATDGHAWAIGHDTALDGSLPDGVLDAWLVLGSADLAGGTSVDDLSPVVERVVATNVQFPDQDIAQDLHANAVVADDLVVMPGGDQLGITLSTVLHGDQLLDQAGNVAVPSLDMSSEEY